MDTRNSNSQQRHQDTPDNLGMPARSTPAAPTPSQPKAEQIPAAPSHQRQDLANMRQSYGFDDIPVDEDDMENVRFRDIFGAWAKQTIKHSELEDKAKQVVAKKKRLNDLKNDLKWALQADLDEPVKPAVKPQKNPQALPSQQKSPAIISPAAPQHTTQQHPLVQPGLHDSPKTIDININFGSLPKLPTTSGKKAVSSAFAKIKAIRVTKKQSLVLATLSIVIIGGIISWKSIPGLPGAPNTGGGKVASQSGSENPEYSTLLPSGKSVDSLGGWHRVSPPDRDAVYAYSDSIDNIAINVSQQPLPEGFKSDPTGSIAELAKAYGATKKLEAGSTVAYLGTSVHGPQSAILSKNNTLILMKSTQKISEDAWTNYIKSLQ